MEVDGVVLRMLGIGAAGLLMVGSALLLTAGKTRLPGILPCVVDTVGRLTMDPADTNPDPALGDCIVGLAMLLPEL